MLAHTLNSIVAEHMNWLDKVYGTPCPLIETRGRDNKYLGMTFEFGLKMGTDISQCDLIKKSYNDLSDDLKGPRRVNPTPNDLLKIDEIGLESCASKNENIITL